ncbi:alkaline phosphatase family protein [Brevundimonas sp. TWP2-3-4b1]|uniref:alkaline phosphatase family protein n=1 Tax=Brevundimonas sp. TWP2-3-4b1 TaxID=2804580 RepID=UPI003CE9E7FF
MLAPVLGSSMAWAAAAENSEAVSRPSLVVVIVIDQFGSNLFNQYRSEFTGGLHELASEGIVYANGYQTHGMTETCPGHSTVLTGVHPNRTGIAGNDWIDRTSGEDVYCLAAPANSLADGGHGENGPVGPDQLRATGLGDWLKAANPQNRVFSVSGKDRGAINLAGASPDGAFWWLDGFGFTTYLRPGENAEERLSPVQELNAGLRARMTAGPTLWEVPAPNSRCATLAGDWTIGGGVFHSAVPPSRLTVDTSPLLDELTVEAAVALLQEQRLGLGSGTDLLGISISGTDRIGHRYGSQGPEMCQQMHRMDAALARLLDAVKQVPGALVVLTADHGGSDFVERLAARGYPEAQRADPMMITRLNTELRDRFVLAVDPMKADGSNVYLVGEGGRPLVEPLRSDVAAAAVELLKSEPGVVDAFSIDELIALPIAARDIRPEDLTVRERMGLSAVAGRSADVMFVLEPGMSPFPGAVGGYLAGHGTPWDYDRRVPLIFWTAEIAGHERPLPVRTVDIAPTLANVLAVQAPADLDGRCLDLTPVASSCEAAP